MLKKEITFKDYNGNEVKKTCYFNLEKAELLELEMSTGGGLAEHIQKLIDEKNVPEIFKLFKMIVLKSYGVKSDDGSMFVKNEQVREAFVSSPAYSNIVMEIVQSAEAAEAFMKAVLPELPSNAKLPENATK